MTAPQEPMAQEELLKYFWPHPYPSSHPPTQVMFSNGLPESDYDFIHKVFVMPYHTFKAAIEAEASRRERAAEERLLDELEAALPRQTERVADFIATKRGKSQ